MDETEITRKVRISKLEAAKRQLDCAIDLWAHDKDEVPIYALASAAFQIILDVNQRRGTGCEMLYDYVKPEYKGFLRKLIKAPANFFKHADNDPEDSIEFPPSVSLALIVFSFIGLRTLDETPSDYTHAFGIWTYMHDPEMLLDDFCENMRRSIPAEDIAAVRQLKKSEFFDTFLRARAELRRLGKIR